MQKYNREIIIIKSSPFVIVLKNKNEFIKSHLDKSTIKKLERDCMRGICI